MSKKQAIRLSEKNQQKDRAWLIVAIIIASVLCMLTVMRTFDSHKVAMEVIDNANPTTCETTMHPLYAYATGAGIDATVEAAISGSETVCN